MPALHKGWRGRVLAALLMAMPPLALVASPGQETATPDQVREAAAVALKQGRNAQAYSFSEALLHRDPQDRLALLIKSRSARSLGEFRDARLSARQAWKLAESDSQKYAASMVMAQALSSGGQKTLAKFWLRRAVQHAPNRHLERVAIRDFRYVRAASPWLHRFSFSVAPESNINNGSSERSSFLNYALTEVLLGGPAEFQLGGSQRALSGIEYSFNSRSRFRFRETPTRAHDLTVAVDLRTYTLSSEAKAQAPDAKGSDFSYASYALGYAHKGLNFDRKGEYRLSGQAGQSWYGGDEYTRFIRLSAGQSYKLERQRRVNARLSTERQFGVMTSDQDTWRGDLSYSFRLGSGATLWSGLTLAQASASTASNEFSEAGLSTQLTLAKPVLGATVLFGLSARDRDYDVSRHSPDGRQDRKYSADVSLLFRDIDYYGFNPTLRLSASKNDSNIGLYESHRFGVNFGIQSAF
ncbi:DUF560 domain-containing protein [Leisingera sp. HS039]|uniref:surface lipoprotein assembly modifier n=1 Tax=Leisingera sp. HS039 TaxID=2818496 RepID=UPI001B3A66D4|nr:surface lipoprotein assembly modifier [Leisingera sp. HS039]MBQ4826458.1 DUF560 domain-containing protein [Leisingera sp. HS039]